MLKKTICILKKSAVRGLALTLGILFLLALVPRPAAAEGAAEYALRPVLRPGKPEVTKSPTGETLDIGGSNSFIAKANGATKMQWMFVDTAGKSHTASQARSLLKGLRTKGENSEKLIISNVPAAMSGWKVYCVFSDDAGNKAETKRATIKVRQAKPSVTKSPSGETVQEGAKVSFIARADNATSILWYFAKGKTVVKATGAEKKFNGLKVSGATSEKLLLTNVPASLDGYQVYAVFTNDAGTAQSNKATIKVNAKNAAAPAESPVPVTPFSSDEPVAPDYSITDRENDGEPMDGEGTEEPVHEHAFAPEWTGDENGHYHLCACGEHSEPVNPHEMETEVVAKATRRENGLAIDTCSVCGYKVERVLPATGNASSGMSTGLKVLIGIVVALAVAVAGLAGYAYFRRMQHRKRKAQRQASEDDYGYENGDGYASGDGYDGEDGGDGYEE